VPPPLIGSDGKITPGQTAAPHGCSEFARLLLEGRSGFAHIVHAAQPRPQGASYSIAASVQMAPQRRCQEPVPHQLGDGYGVQQVLDQQVGPAAGIRLPPEGTDLAGNLWMMSRTPRGDNRVGLEGITHGVNSLIVPVGVA
jgi:hypothetical protein